MEDDIDRYDQGKRRHKKANRGSWKGNGQKEKEISSNTVDDKKLVGSIRSILRNELDGQEKTRTTTDKEPEYEEDARRKDKAERVEEMERMMKEINDNLKDAWEKNKEVMMSMFVQIMCKALMLMDEKEPATTMTTTKTTTKQDKRTTTTTKTTETNISTTVKENIYDDEEKNNDKDNEKTTKTTETNISTTGKENIDDDEEKNKDKDNEKTTKTMTKTKKQEPEKIGGRLENGPPEKIKNKNDKRMCDT
jgi:hypothetical protein